VSTDGQMNGQTDRVKHLMRPGLLGSVVLSNHFTISQYMEREARLRAPYTVTI